MNPANIQPQNGMTPMGGEHGMGGSFNQMFPFKVPSGATGGSPSGGVIPPIVGWPGAAPPGGSSPGPAGGCGAPGAAPPPTGWPLAGSTIGGGAAGGIPGPPTAIGAVLGAPVGSVGGAKPCCGAGAGAMPIAYLVRMDRALL